MGRKKHKITKIEKAKANDIKVFKCPYCGANLPPSDDCLFILWC